MMIMQSRKIKGAISLLELIVVIAIISLLAVAAMPSYERYVVRSKILSMMPIISGFKPAVIRDHNEGIVFGNTTEDLIPSNASNKPEYLYALRRGPYGCIEAEFDLVCPATESAGNADDWTCGYSSTTSPEYINYFSIECQDEVVRDTSF
jgi:Tfp pilus assembly protein PilE